MARLIELDWPDYGPAPVRPEFTADELTARIERVREAMSARGLDYAIVYADREHFANLAWLTNFDPRFEEALLILGHREPPLLLVGNECMAYVKISPLLAPGLLRVERFAPFSLPDQPRENSRTLEAILRAEGLDTASRVGAAGMKSYGDNRILDIPAYIADTIRTIANAAENIADLFIALRSIATAAEIAFFEYTNYHASEGIRRMQFALRTGMTDRELIAEARYDGLPLSCHLTCKTGPKRVSLASASGAVIERGYPWSANIAYWGSNICRAGWVAESEADLPEQARDYADAYAGPYMDAIAAWLQRLAIGTEGGELHALIQRLLPFDKYGVFLNPGHLIHFEEWLCSPIYAGSTEPIRSGMVFQTDIIPSNPIYFSARMEDGLAIANQTLREEIAARFPDAWRRIVARRQFAAETLGFPLSEDHLPLSNTFGLVAPFVLNPHRVFAIG